MDGAGKSLRFVEGLVGLKTVVKLAQESLEDVTQCGGVPIAVCSAPVIVVLDRARSRDGGEGPDEADCGQSIVLHVTVGNAGAAPGCSRDGCGAGECLEPASVGKPAAVVADLCLDPGAGGLP